MRRFLIVALSLASLGADIASAKPVVIRDGLHYTKDQLKKECDQDGGTFSVEGDGKFSCVKGDTGLAINCDNNGSCKSVCNTKACGNDSKAGTPPKAKIGGRTITGLGSTTKFGGTATGTRGGTATSGNTGGGVMFGSTSGGTTPAGIMGGGPNGVTAVVPRPTLPSTGGAFDVTRTGVGAGPIAGGIINGRK